MCHNRVSPDDLECSVCLDTISSADIKRTTCNHCFHRKCLDKWLENHETCPYCRKTILYRGTAVPLEDIIAVAVFTPMYGHHNVETMLQNRLRVIMQHSLAYSDIHIRRWQASAPQPMDDTHAPPVIMAQPITEEQLRQYTPASPAPPAPLMDEAPSVVEAPNREEAPLASQSPPAETASSHHRHRGRFWSMFAMCR